MRRDLGPNRGGTRCRLGWSLAGLVALTATLLVPLAASSQERAPRFERFLGLTAQMGFVNDPYGVAVSPGDDGRVYVVDRGNARIQVFSSTGQAVGMWGSRGNGPHQFWLPSDAAVSPDGRYVYVLDEGHRQVKRFEPAPDCFPPGDRECFGPTRVLVFGYYGFGDQGQMQDPTGIAVDRQGTVLVADTVLHRVVVFDVDGRALGSFGVPGNGPGELLNPTDVAVHPDGTIWVADTGNDRIAFFSADRVYQGQWTGGGQRGRLFRPTGIAIDRDGRYIVRDFEPSYQLPQASLHDANRRSVWSMNLGDGGKQGVFTVQGAAFLPDGSSLLTDPAADDAALVHVLPSGVQQRWGATRGRHPLQYDQPVAVALDEHLLAVADGGNRRAVVAQRLADGERFLTVLGPPLKPEFALASPQGVAIYRTGPAFDEAIVYIADAGSHSIWISSPTGDLLGRWGTGVGRSGPDGLKAPHGIAVAPNGDVYIADTGNNRIVRRAGYPRDEILGIIGRTGSGPGEMEFPRAVAYGPGDRIYVLETVKNRLQAFSTSGAYVGVWDSGQSKNIESGELWMPRGLAADGRYLYVLECDAPYDHVRVQVVDPHPGVPLADSLVATFADQAGPGPGQVWNPHGLAATAAGHVVVADTGNNRLSLYRWPDEGAVPTATETSEPDTPTPEQPSPVSTSTPTDEPATETPGPSTPTATESPTPEPSPPTPTGSPSPLPLTGTPDPDPTETPWPSPTPSPTLTTTPGTATDLPPPSVTATAPPSANTQPTPVGGGRRIYLPLTVRSFRVGTTWR